MSHVARDGHTRIEELALVGLVFRRDADHNRFQALETRGRLKVGALLAAVQRGSALGALPLEVGSRAEKRGTVVAPGSSHSLHHARQPRPGNIDGRSGTLRAGAIDVSPERAVLGLWAVGVVITPLPVEGTGEAE